jgi:hypothetical protein
VYVQQIEDTAVHHGIWLFGWIVPRSPRKGNFPCKNLRHLPTRTEHSFSFLAAFESDPAAGRRTPILLRPHTPHEMTVIVDRSRSCSLKAVCCMLYAVCYMLCRFILQYRYLPLPRLVLMRSIRHHFFCMVIQRPSTPPLT